MPDQPMTERLAEAGSASSWQQMRARLIARYNLPDTSTPEFRAEAKRQAAIIRGTPADQEALDFIEAMMAEGGWTDHWDVFDEAPCSAA